MKMEPGKRKGLEAVADSRGVIAAAAMDQRGSLKSAIVSGVLCGRATWKEGIPIYAKQGVQALEDWLADQGVRNIKNVNDRLKAASPWFAFYGAASASALS